MGKSGFLDKLKAQQAVRERELRRFTLQQSHDLAIIALHKEFGFGPERIKRFSDKCLEVWNEYADIANADADSDKSMDYTHEKLDRALKEACGDYFVEWEERYR